MKSDWDWVQPIHPIYVNELPPGEKRVAKELVRLMALVRRQLRGPHLSPRGRDRILQELDNVQRRLTEPKQWRKKASAKGAPEGTRSSMGRLKTTLPCMS